MCIDNPLRVSAWRCDFQYKYCDITPGSSLFSCILFQILPFLSPVHHFFTYIVCFILPAPVPLSSFLVAVTLPNSLKTSKESFYVVQKHTVNMISSQLVMLKTVTGDTKACASLCFASNPWRSCSWCLIVCLVWLPLVIASRKKILLSKTHSWVWKLSLPCLSFLRLTILIRN